MVRQARGLAKMESIVVLCEQRYLAQSQPVDFVRALLRRNVPVSLVTIEELFETPVLNVDLVVARGRSPTLLKALAQYEARGILTINTSNAITAVVDKWRMAQAFRTRGIPTPRTWLSPVAKLREYIQEFPVVIKPVFGDNGRDVILLRDREQLEQLEWREPFALVQAFVAGDPLDLKLYGINGSVWAVRKPSPLVDCAGMTSDEPAEELPSSSYLHRLAQRCADIFDLALYGVDCVLGAQGPQVIEINDFPNYTRVENAGDRIAEFVLNTAESARP